MVVHVTTLDLITLVIVYLAFRGGGNLMRHAAQSFVGWLVSLFPCAYLEMYVESSLHFCRSIYFPYECNADNVQQDDIDRNSGEKLGEQ